MEPVPSISDAEWQVMKFIWTHTPATTNDVVDALTACTDWKPKTIMTLLNRLVKKHALGFEKKGRVYEYTPLVAESDCVRQENRFFLQRVYGGHLKPMLAEFLRDADLSKEDLDELKRILDEGKSK
jgi:BlaI family transcriptional regulator, penicillinase repressor